MTISTVTINLAGNNPHGQRTGAKRAKAYAAYRIKYPVDILCVQETTVLSKVRPTLDKALKPTYRRVAGGKGRYIYAHKRLTIIAGGLITTPKNTWYKRDAKQAAWIVHETAGIRGIDVSFHLEHDAKAGQHRLAQMAAIVAQAVVIAKKYQVKPHNICFAGDANSTTEVPRLMARLGYPSTARGTSCENTPTFHGWDGRSANRIDYIFSPTGSLTGIIANKIISDHASLHARRQLTKDPLMTPRELQEVLSSLGFLLGRVDGRIGPRTRGAIHRFQRAYALSRDALLVDGECGPKTQAALEHASRLGRLSPHFTAAELRCKCQGKHKDCLGILVSRADLLALEALRAKAYPDGLKIVSAYRCKKHNASIRGASRKSQHVAGTAFDIPGVVETESNLIPARFKGRGTRGGRVVHIDSRPTEARWKY